MTTDKKITLTESDIPTHYYNIAPDLPTPMEPPLHPNCQCGVRYVVVPAFVDEEALA